MDERIDARRRDSSGGSSDLQDCIHKIQWQRIQDSLAQVTGIAIRTVDSQGQELTVASSPSRFCSLVKASHHGEQLCRPCLPTFLGGQGILDRNLRFNCASGLYSFLAPLRVQGEHLVAYLVIGPVILVMRQPKEAYRSLADEAGCSLDELWDALLEVKVLSFSSAQSVVFFSKDIAEYVVSLACQHLELESGMQHKLDDAAWFDSLSSSAQLPKFLNVLLDVAFSITGADVGSIMLYDVATKLLQIKIAKGLSDDIVRNSAVPLGQGLAGMAAQENRALILDDTVRENRVRALLRRPEIHSSMVIPFTIRQRLLGVVNIGVKSPATASFNDQNMALVQRLIDLAGIAITHISPSSNP